ncbi:MAG: EthD domain-containing protein, partial [Novosphingobium sp.]|nr:EthD domain-containing protein [Novosphingobium sp.]
MPEGLPPGPVKLVILPKTRSGLGRAGLRAHLERIHGPMVVAEPDVSGGFTGYVHHYAHDHQVEPALAGRDAITVIRFGDIADMVASKASVAYRDRVGPDEDNFRELAGSVALFAQERVAAPGGDQAASKLFVFRAVDRLDLDAWTAALAALAAHPGVTGLVSNRAQVAEGDFPYNQFDEIGLGADA